MFLLESPRKTYGLMNDEISAHRVIDMLEIAETAGHEKSGHTHFKTQLFGLYRKNPQVVTSAISKGVDELAQRRVDLTQRDLGRLAAVVITPRRCKPAVENRLKITLVDQQHSTGTQQATKALQHLDTLLLLEEMTDRTSQTKHRIEPAQLLWIELTPVTADDRDVQTAAGKIGFGTPHHGRAAVARRHVEPGAPQLHGMKPTASGRIENPAGTDLEQLLNEEITLSLCPFAPVDQFIPTTDEISVVLPGVVLIETEI